MSTMTTDELALELARRLTDRIQVACPTVAADVLDDLAEQLLSTLYRVADAAAEAERKRLRPGSWH